MQAFKISFGIKLGDFTLLRQKAQKAQEEKSHRP